MIILIYEEEIYVKTNEEYLKSLNDVVIFGSDFKYEEPIIEIYCKEFDTRNLHEDKCLLCNINYNIFQYIMNNKLSFQIINYRLKHLIDRRDEFNEFIRYLYSLNKDKFKYELDCYFDRYDDYGYINNYMSKENLYNYFKSFMCPDIDELELKNIINIDYYYHGDDEIAYVCKYKIIEIELNGHKIKRYCPDIDFPNNETYMFLNDYDIIIFDVIDSFEIYNKILHFDNDWNNISKIDNNIFMICKLNSCFKIIMTDNPISDILFYYLPKLKNIEFIDYNLITIVLHASEYKNDIDEYKIDNYWFKTLYNYNKDKFMKKLKKLYNEVDMETDYDEYINNECNSDKMFYDDSIAAHIMNIINKQLNE